MKRKMLALLLGVTLMATTVVGCSKKADNSAKSETTTEETTESTTDDAATTDDTAATEEATLTTDPVTLTVWESTGGPDEFIKQAGEAFTAKYPNIKIDFVNVELGDTTSQIALDGPAGVGPDVFAAPHDKLGELVSGGHVLPTEKADEITSKVLASCSTALSYDGTMYGYPVSAETYALFYNKALIKEEEVPKTWDDVKTFAEKFNKDNSGKYGFMMDVGNGYYSIIFTTKDDNRLFGPEGTDTTNTNINSAASVEGMKFFQGLRTILDAPAADLATATCDAAFSSGNVAMYITGLWNVATFKDAGIDFGVTTLPSLPGNDTPAASFAGTRAMFVSAYSEHPAEAAAFAEFLLTDEMQKLRFELTGSLPAINTTVDSPYIEGFLKQLEYAF
ncbi:MAG TPA: maltose ABC transporter substrate-binding protein, partial [Lachnospiraceae bacterium]|nr:maltose ABC transporter substrate-binding protein [Lachnospiraceae bacterium]